MESAMTAREVIYRLSNPAWVASHAMRQVTTMYDLVSPSEVFETVSSGQRPDDGQQRAPARAAPRRHARRPGRHPRGHRSNAAPRAAAARR
jgi:hypothetical protein